MFFRYIGILRQAIDLDNIFNGSCFLVGGGYQLSQVKDKLNDRRLVTMAMNNAATQFDPTLWTGADTAEHYSESILMNPSIMKFMYLTRKATLVRGYQACQLPNIYFAVGLNKPAGSFFLRDRDFHWWSNVFTFALQLLHRLGFNRVYTVGCGFKIDTSTGAYSYKTDLNAEQVAYNQRTYAMVIRHMRTISAASKNAHFEIISCTPDSALNDLVPYRDFDEAYEEEIGKVPAHRTTGLRHPKSKPKEPETPVIDATARDKKVSILIPTFNRDDLLDLGLKSIAAQKAPNVEILVLNDGPHSESTEQVAKVNGATYVHTGVRFNKDPNSLWRVPGYALNVGVKLAKGDILVLTCPEIFHVTQDCIEQLVAPLIKDPLAVGIPVGKDDDGKYLAAVKAGAATDDLFSKLGVLRTELPFLMAVSRQAYTAIGGYDEDFTGRCFDDDDFSGRLVAHGCKFTQTGARCVHLYHPRLSIKDTGDHKRVAYNKKLFMDRRGSVIRNVGREWGVLSES